MGAVGRADQDVRNAVSVEIAGGGDRSAEQVARELSWNEEEKAAVRPGKDLDVTFRMGSSMLRWSAPRVVGETVSIEIAEARNGGPEKVARSFAVGS